MILMQFTLVLKTFTFEFVNRKITELEEELKVVGNNMKSLEISEQEVNRDCPTTTGRPQPRGRDAPSPRLRQSTLLLYLPWSTFRAAVSNMRTTTF